MIRAFFAIELSDDLRNEIRRLQDDLKKTGADVKWVRPQSVHLTLKFLGQTAEDIIEPLGKAVSGAVAPYPALTLKLGRTGVFPHRRRPRVTWVGLDGDLVELAFLQRAVEEQAAGFGFAAEKRSFSPHLTLGRIRSGKNKDALLTALDRLEPEPLVLVAREIILYKSDLKPSGAVYTPLKRLPLKENPMEEES
ncbi:MAG: RNA 2',3'-cyclic phosphodiesterase [Deltaproteobacteria bacterium]|nr:RNA 2',3'-cyclic phosphodiesterase [Deltaproteobacteria bacterium]